jgi:hypothetical protein
MEYEQTAETTHVSAATVLIVAERGRQIEAEGYTPEHDAEHGRASLARAAIEYEYARFGWRWPSVFWPWDKAAFKPRDRVNNLIRAGALYLAALDLPEPERPLWSVDRTEHLRRSLERVTTELDATLDAAHLIYPPGKTI